MLPHLTQSSGVTGMKCLVWNDHVTSVSRGECLWIPETGGSFSLGTRTSEEVAYGDDL